jgi:hypothetical protein
LDISQAGTHIIDEILITLIYFELKRTGKGPNVLHKEPPGVVEGLDTTVAEGQGEGEEFRTAVLEGGDDMTGRTEGESS